MTVKKKPTAKKAARGPAHKAAETKYYEKRKAQPRLPGCYIDEEYAALLDKVAAHFGSKKTAIREALALLAKSLKL